jgi:hypothetical protein
MRFVAIAPQPSSCSTTKSVNPRLTGMRRSSGGLDVEDVVLPEAAVPRLAGLAGLQHALPDRPPSGQKTQPGPGRRVRGHAG